MFFLFVQLLFASPNQNDTPGPKNGRIVAVYDGDTFTLDNGEKIRLRGVNTPELRPKEKFGIEARDAAANLLINQDVELEYGSVHRDAYGRLIASVTVEGVDVAEYLAREGLGHVFLIPPDNLSNEQALLDAQSQAQDKNKGIWSLSRYGSNLHMTSFHANAPGNDNDNINGEYIRVCNTTYKTLNIGGYIITDIHGKKWVFPDMDIPAGHTFKVISGQGKHQKEPTRQLEVYLGSYRPIWNNDHDRATIFSSDGSIQDTREHKPKSRQK
jgi:micrococcal nuclease